jgi:hypothetical protein
VDGEGDIVKKIDYGKMAYPQSVTSYISISSFYQPLFIIGGNLYITQTPNYEYGDKVLEKSPVSILIDTLHKTIQSSSFTYPIIVSSEDYFKVKNFEYGLSRLFDGKQIIYSFAFDDNIYVTSIKNDLVKKLSVKSRYIQQVKPPSHENATVNSYGKILCETPSYGNLVYDKYRDVYYRFVHPGAEMENDIADYGEIVRYGGKHFSIIILDHDLNSIGETPVFPDYANAPRVCFVAKDGLFICDNTPMQNDFDEDVLSFQQFELVKTK